MHHPGRVAVHIIDRRADAARGGVLAADRGILDRDAGGVGEADAEIPVGHDLDILDRHVGGVDPEVVGNVKAAEHRPFPVTITALPAAL